MNPGQVASALNEIVRRGWELGAIVHSHPTGPATPSATDLRESFYPSAWMAIVSFTADRPELRVWRMRGSASFVEIPLTIDGKSPDEVAAC